MGDRHMGGGEDVRQNENVFIIFFEMVDQNAIEEMMRIERYEMKSYKPEGWIQQFSYLLVRPPRLLYNEDLLKPKKSSGKSYHYTVFHIPFPLSLYQPINMEYVILYLHGNASSRIEGLNQLSFLPKNAGLACFDFDGCGNRVQKDFISLGKAESGEVDIAVSFLRSKGYRVVGWGRSMGSVSLLLSSQCQILIADSPFSNLKNLCYEQSSKYVPLFCKPCFMCLFPCLLCCVECDIETKANVTFQQLDIAARINENKNRSILFLAGTQDNLISYKHAQRLFHRFQGRKKIIFFEGDHHSDRPIEVLVAAYVWIDGQLERLQIQSESGKVGSSPPCKQQIGKSIEQAALINDYQCLQTPPNSQSLELMQEKLITECQGSRAIESQEQLDNL